MDATTQRLVEALQAFHEVNGKTAPEPVLDALSEVENMLVAPRYGPESPGEKEAREVSEKAASQSDLFEVPIEMGTT